ncbi:MAG: hypothetical protein K0R57_2616 [Paenibacillaceae bacterium]|jgi:hypothetical protein|nr:hypothetical protein [Paenibacillaceae bacterium]
MIKERLITILLTLIALAFQHIIHEVSHIIAAKYTGIKVLRVQWLTYHGGTRVFYEDEPDLRTDLNIGKKWGMISGAGFMITNTLGYIGAISLQLIDNTSHAWMKVALTFLVLIFLSVDCIYFLLGSIFDFGDIMGVRAVWHISKMISIILCGFMVVFNFAIIKILIY